MPKTFIYKNFRKDGAHDTLLFYTMFNIGDVVSIQTEFVDGFPHARNSIGGLFPVNRKYYEILSDVGNGLYVIGVGNLAIAVVSCHTLRLENIPQAWEPVLLDGIVSIKSGARNYMGYPLPSYVYEQKYAVINVIYDRVLLGNGMQTLAMKGEDLI